MKDIYTEVTDTAEIEYLCREQFGIELTVKRTIAEEVSSGKGSHTTIFEDDRRIMYALCTSDKPLVLADVKDIMINMGIEADSYIPPNGDTQYFLRFGQEAFAARYPSRRLSTDEEMKFYQTLAPYSPALVRILRIKGEIREYFAALQQWQKSRTYSYTRIRVQ